MTPSMLDGSDIHWLMYSDWLEDQGKEEYAQEIREAVEFNSTPWTFEYRGVGVGVGVGGGVGGGGGGVGVGIGGLVGGVGGVGVVGGVGRVGGGGGVGG